MPYRTMANLTEGTPNPTAGIIMVAVGSTTWLYGAAARAFAPAAAAIQQGTVPLVGMTWADFGTTVGGLCSLAGILVTCYVGIRAKFAVGANDRKRDAGMADIQLFIAGEMAKIQVEAARRHAAVCEHLGRQDVAIEAAKHQVAAAAPGAEPAPIILP